MSDYDLIAIGGGAAGLVTAAGAAGLGARVALIEQHRLGGECLWTGCVPSKALLACARAAAAARTAERYGIRVGDVRVDFPAVMRHVHAAQLALEPNDSPQRFRSLGVDVIEGTARFVGERALRVGERTLSARHVVIATGSRPAPPPIPGIDGVPYYTNENIFQIERQPASLIIIGGGPVGVELAQAFALLGARVIVLEATAHLLATEDAQLSELLKGYLAEDGVEFRLNARVQAVEQTAAGVRVRVDDASLEAEALLVAAGRYANTAALELSVAGVVADAHGVQVDDKLQSTAPNVWSAGDVTANAPRFTHVADYHARLVLRNALFPGHSKVNYDVVPWAIYTDPELAHVGLTERQARDRYGDRVRVWTRHFHELDRAVADGQTRGALKIISDARGRILGGHALGQHASSIVAEIALAMRHDIPLSRIASVIHAYPTYPELTKQAADAFVRSRFTGAARKLAGWLVRR